MSLIFDKNLWVFQDIDMVSFPFKKQLIKYMREEHKKLNSLINLYEKSDRSYFEWFLKKYIDDNFDKEKNKWTILGEFISEFNKIKKVKSVDIETYVNDMHRSLLRNFGDSKYFLSSRNEEIYELNKELKNLGVNIIGITSRGRVDDENWLYKNCKEKTLLWNKNEEMNYDKIFLQDFSDKHRVIKNLEKENKDFSVDRVICMMEDNAKGLINLSNLGVPGVLYDVDNWRNQEYIDKINKKHSGLLTVVKNYEDMKNTVLLMTNEKIN
ncbi:hypothetical protein K9L67_02315 [Candidatus Woesearchaeota archaeon]|nr:hypothetical protein [Candidatus Woesearchaeota archaeon]MCF7901039.1 hypothetical protein [Candidatus Woesearchaeota archaeon]MCF8013380.1 hypothetical protein [Candidatus Woesearchaeota archaeon]